MRRKSPLIKQNIIDYIRSYSAEYGFSPSIREIASAVGLRSTSGANSYIEELVSEGYIRKSPVKSRAIDLMGFSESASYPVIPIIKGYAKRLFDVSNIEGYISVPLPADSDVDSYFAIKVSDSSMADSGIISGDIVLSERPEYVNDGTCSVCLYGDKLLIRYIFLEGNRVRLVPAGAGYSEEIVDSCQVIGVVFGNIHYGQYGG